jgi:hypothetical protein
MENYICYLCSPHPVPLRQLAEEGEREGARIP